MNIQERRKTWEWGGLEVVSRLVVAGKHKLSLRSSFRQTKVCRWEQGLATKSKDNSNKQSTGSSPLKSACQIKHQKPLFAAHLHPWSTTRNVKKHYFWSEFQFLFCKPEKTWNFMPVLCCPRQTTGRRNKEFHDMITKDLRRVQELVRNWIKARWTDAWVLSSAFSFRNLYRHQSSADTAANSIPGEIEKLLIKKYSEAIAVPLQLINLLKISISIYDLMVIASAV